MIDLCHRAGLRPVYKGSCSSNDDRGLDLNWRGLELNADRCGKIQRNNKLFDCNRLITEFFHEQGISPNLNAGKNKKPCGVGTRRETDLGDGYSHILYRHSGILIEGKAHYGTGGASIKRNRAEEQH